MNIGSLGVNGTVVQGYTVGAGGVLSFNQVNPSRYLAVATGSSYDVLTGILTLAWNRDISTVPVRASITNTLGTSVTDFAAIPTTTLYDNAQTFVTNGSVKGTIYAGNTAVQTFSTGNTTTDSTNTVAVVATDTSTTFAALAHPVSIYADNYISDITTTPAVARPTGASWNVALNAPCEKPSPTTTSSSPATAACSSRGVIDATRGVGAGGRSDDVKATTPLARRPSAFSTTTLRRPASFTAGNVVDKTSPFIANAISLPVMRFNCCASASSGQAWMSWSAFGKRASLPNAARGSMMMV